MITLATTMADSIIKFERRVAGRDIKPTGELSVTTPDALGQHFMLAIVAQFQALNPGVVVELILSNQSLGLACRDADIAIRLTNDPPETLVGRKICTGRWGIYCRRELAAALGSEPIDSVAFMGFGAGFRPALSAVDRGDVHPGRCRPGRIRCTACLSLRFRVSARHCCLVFLAIEART